MKLFFALCFLIAVLFFVAGAFVTWDKQGRRIHLGFLGLAFFATPFLVQAFQAV